MIIDVLKYLIIGAKEDLDKFFERAQESGILEFLSISGKKQIEYPAPIQSLLSAIKILKRYPALEERSGEGSLTFAMQICERIIELKQDIEKLSEEKRVLEAEISRVAPYGPFSMEDLEYIEKMGHRKIQFFCMKTAASHKTNFTDEVIYVGTEYDLDYFITINPEAREYPHMIEIRIDMPVNELQARHSFVASSIQRSEAELKDYSGYINFLKTTLLDELNRHYLNAAKKEVSYPLKDALFAIEAYVPKTKVGPFFELLGNMAIHAEEIGLEKEERVPTCLENTGLGLVGEEVIKIYDVPATTDKDPSRIVLWFFALFFGIIVGDGGYGFLFLILAFYLKRKFPEVHGSGARYLKLFFLLSYSCIAWGLLTGSYFGLRLSPDNTLVKIAPMHYLVEQKASYHLAQKDDVYCTWIGHVPSLINAKDGHEFLAQAVVMKKGRPNYQMQEEFVSNILLELTLLIGVIHVTIGLLRYLRRNIAGLGWIAFMWGGYLYFPSFLKATSLMNFTGIVSKPMASAIGLQLIMGGIGFALVAALIQRRLKGLNEVGHLVQVFADVLSYLRLYALSLAGAIMAATFNQEGSALGLVAGAVVIILGHGINIALGFMGGVIHGLRLNFLEWYHYCFDGGGRLFRPLRKLKIK